MVVCSPEPAMGDLVPQEETERLAFGTQGVEPTYGVLVDLTLMEGMGARFVVRWLIMIGLTGLRPDTRL